MAIKSRLISQIAALVIFKLIARTHSATPVWKIRTSTKPRPIQISSPTFPLGTALLNANRTP